MVLYTMEKSFQMHSDILSESYRRAMRTWLTWNQGPETPVVSVEADKAWTLTQGFGFNLIHKKVSYLKQVCDIADMLGELT